MKATKNFVKCLMAIFVMVMAFSVTGITAKANDFITQTNQDKNSVTVTWAAQENAVEYYVGISTHIATATSIAQSKAITLPATTTSYTFSGLTEGTNYVVVVRYKYSSASGETDAHLDSLVYAKTLPGKVTGLNQERWLYYGKSVDFKWDDQTAANFEVVVKSNKNKVLLKNSTSRSKGFYSKVKNNQIYKVQVRAYITVNKKNFYGPYSDTAYLFTQPMIKKAKVKGGKLNITWGKISGTTGYDVYVSTEEKSGYKKVKSVSKSKSSLTVKKFKGKKFSTKKKYYVYLVAKKKVGKRTYTSGKHYTYEVKQGKLNRTFIKKLLH